MRTFGDDIMGRLEEPVEEICEELDYAKTAPSRLQDQSDANKRDNIRGGEDARRYPPHTNTTHTTHHTTYRSRAVEREGATRLGTVRRRPIWTRARAG